MFHLVYCFYCIFNLFWWGEWLLTLTCLESVESGRESQSQMSMCVAGYMNKAGSNRDYRSVLRKQVYGSFILK